MTGDFLPFSSPELGESEKKAILSALESGWISTAGPIVPQFEKDLSAYFGGIGVLATQSGTSALHLALLAAGIGPGDRVLVPAFSFIAPANTVKYVGASVAFVDCEERCLQMDLDALESQLQKEPNIRAILAVHTIGNSIPMQRLRDLAEKNGCHVIEDASQSLGASIDGQRVGSWGDLSTLSFNGNKMITTGGGGAVLTRNARWYQQMASLSNQAKADREEYVHREVGYNYRMTSLAAALGSAQLPRISSFVDKRRQIGDFYRSIIDASGWASVIPRSDPSSTDWLPVVVFKENEARDEVASRLKGAGVPVRRLWEPLTLSHAHVESRSLPAPRAEDLYRRCLALPSSTTWTARTFENLGEILEKIF